MSEPKMTADGMFELMLKGSARWRCTVCGRTGHWYDGERGWMAQCRAGHHYPCPACGKRLTTRGGFTQHLLRTLDDQHIQWRKESGERPQPNKGENDVHL